MFDDPNQPNALTADELPDEQWYYHQSLKRRIGNEIGQPFQVSRFSSHGYSPEFSRHIMNLPAAVPVTNLANSAGFRLDLHGLGERGLL